MNKENIMELFSFSNSGSGNYLYNSSYKSISEVVDKILILYKLSIDEQEAKVYTYEKIIANSNFAPILKENKELKEINKEQANHLISKDNLSYEDYKSRIDKAIEYIHNNQPVFELSSKQQLQEWFEKEYYVELLNILNGD